MTMPSLHIAGRRVSGEDPCFVIAEIGINHNGSLEMALKLVDAVVDAKADAVKFQKRNIKSLYPKKLLDDPNTAEWAFQYMLPILKEMELTPDEFRRIKEHCDERGILFMCTPWDEESLEFLEELDVPAYKVSSADLTNTPLLKRIASKGKPLIISTGMSTIDEIQCVVDFLKTLDVESAILHCCSTYPAPFEDINLRFIDTLKQYGLPVGYSGHERGIMIPVAARVMGCCIIEKHITLDRTLPGPDHPASLEPQGFTRMVRDLRNLETALGKNEKEISTMEALNRQVLRKSLVAARDLSLGEVIKEEDLLVRGPGKGLSPQRMAEVVGTQAKRDIAEGDYFIEADLSGHEVLRIQSSDFRHPWGFKVRLHDWADYLHYAPNLVEFHFSEDDVRSKFEPLEERYQVQLFVHAPEIFNRRLVDFCSPNKVIRDNSVELLQRTIDRFKQYEPYFDGAGGIIIHIGGMSLDEPNPDTDPMYDRALECFRKLDAKDLFLMPENLPPRPWYLGGQWYQNAFKIPEEMVAFCKAGDLEMTYDTSHAQLYCNDVGRTLTEFTEICLPYIRHVHIGDATGIDGEGIQVGEGDVPWQDVIDIIAEKEFTWVPEIWSGHHNGGEGFITALNRMREFPNF